MKTARKTYRDFDLSELCFGPGGVWEYLDTNNRFQNKFGCGLSRRNFVDMIAKVIPEADRWNKSRQNLQPFVSIYNTAMAGNRSKDIPGGCHAIERTHEILYVFCHVERTKVAGLEDHLKRRGHGELVQAAKDKYEQINKERSKAVYMHDIANQIWQKFESLETLVTATEDKVLNAILDMKEKELVEANEENIRLKEEIRKEFEDTPDEKLREKIYTFIENL